MNNKIKKILIPFILMVLINLGFFYLSSSRNVSQGINAHIGTLLISGLLFGPYGALGASLGNLISDLIRGYPVDFTVISNITGFLISYLGFKLWYRDYRGRSQITKPRLNSTSNFLLFLAIVVGTGFLYSSIHQNIYNLLYSSIGYENATIGVRYFLNYVNSSFVVGIIGMWLSKKIDFIYTPKTSKSRISKKFFKIVFYLLVFSAIFDIFLPFSISDNRIFCIIQTVAYIIVICICLFEPFTSKMSPIREDSIPEKIMNIFLLSIFFMLLISVILAFDQVLIMAVDDFLPLSFMEIVISTFILTDILLILFMIPSLAVLRVVEKRAIRPMLDFSQIENFVREGEKIESDGLVNVYSDYLDEPTEVGVLARSYTDLINYNNRYIDNIAQIEGEKERIKAELDIAKRIQAARLPTEAIENDDFIVEGSSRPAKEVGGDFFDYYMLDDDNLAIVIGDASGKGVPAALLAVITQEMTSQIIKNERNPSKVLYLLNNQLCEKNSETMFITLWVGIYNKNKKTITFSNAGHNPPLIKDNGEFRLLEVNRGLVLGIMEDFEFVSEEISFSSELVVFTDGITDAKNIDGKMYGENSIIEFFNNNNYNQIDLLFDKIDEFSKGTEQFDDMTVLILKDKS